MEKLTLQSGKPIKGGSQLPSPGVNFPTVSASPAQLILTFVLQLTETLCERHKDADCRGKRPGRSAGVFTESLDKLKQSLLVQVQIQEF